MTIEEQIEDLNNTVKCKLAPSPIHGIGVFAIRDISKGEKLYCVSQADIWYSVPLERFKEIRPEIRELILDRWPQPERGRMFKSPNSDARMMSFMNYSKTPNSYADFATKDIKAGEEITEDYSIQHMSQLQKQHYNFI